LNGSIDGGRKCPFDEKQLSRAARRPGLASVTLQNFGNLARRWGIRPFVNDDRAPTEVVVKRNLYTEVSSRFLAKLEHGAAPWVKAGPQQPDSA
jgi:hypothetical protein